ncbi:MAG: hypothetical protein WAK01_11120 [Methylocystis sp.]
MCFPWRGLSRALLITVSLSILGGWSTQAMAQASPDPSMLDTGDAKPEGKAKAKKKSASKPQQPPAGSQAKGGKPGGDRQFGELEGWSPGKNPNGEKKAADDPSGSEPKNGLSMSPSGKPSMGLSF